MYAKCSYYESRWLWLELENLPVLMLPWMVMRDFKCFQDDNERIGGQSRPLVAMEDFNHYINNCGLLELKYFGGRMSCYNGHEGQTRKWATLDKALINIHFINQFQSARMEYLARKMSDQKPLLVHLLDEHSRYGSLPFKYQQTMWSSQDDFFGLMKQVWSEPIHGSS